MVHVLWRVLSGDPLMISALDINYFAGMHRRVALREGSRQQDWDENPPLGGASRRLCLRKFQGRA